MPGLKSLESFSKRTVDAGTGKVQQMAASAARDPDAPIANGWLIFYLALLVAVLVFVVGAVAEWHQGAGQGSVFVDVLWRVTRVTFAVLKTTLIVLVAIWGYRRFISGRREQSLPEDHTRSGSPQDGSSSSGIEWKRVPWPLWVYSALVLLETVLIEVNVQGLVLLRMIIPFVTFAWLFFLLKGVRWIWMATVGLSILSFVPEVVSGSLEWQDLSLSLFSLVLLLLPTTRRYFSSRGARTARPAR